MNRDNLCFRKIPSNRLLQITLVVFWLASLLQKLIQLFYNQDMHRQGKSASLWATVERLQD